MNRYSPDDFAEYSLVEPAAAPNGSPNGKPVEIGPLTLRAAAEPPLELFMELMDGSPKFRATFERRRREFQDQSPSVYDMALASAAVRAGWTDQDAANLVIYWRRRNQFDVEKALREDYLPRMLRKIRQGIAQDEATEILESRYVAQRAGGEPPETAREELLALVRRALEINVDRITRYGQENPEYELVTDQGTVMLGKVDGLIIHLRLRNAIAAACGLYIREFSRERWKAIAQALLDLCELGETGEGTTDQGLLRGWLEDYLLMNPPGELNESTVLGRSPFHRETEAVWIFLDSLSLWLLTRRSEHISTKWLAREMKRLGSQATVINVKVGAKWTTREVWRVPGES